MKKIRVAPVLLLLFLAQGAWAMPAEETVDRLLTGLTIEDETARVELVEELFSQRLLDKHGSAKLAEFLETMHRDLGRPVRPPEIREATRTPTEWNLVVQSEGKAIRAVVEFQAGTGRIDGLMADTEVSAAPAPRPGSIAVEQFPAALRRHLDALVADDEFSGAVLVARNGEPLFAEAYGFADRARNIENTLDTPINVGSMTKMLTGLAVMQLVRQGKIDLDATLGTYLPDLPNEKLRTKATIRQLLTHQAGVGSYWNQAFQKRADTIDDLDGLIETFIDEPLRFEPGSGYEYSNGGPVLLGKVVEVVSGKSYFDYLQQHVYGPAGMKSSGHFRKDDRGVVVARGYHRYGPDQPRKDTHDIRPLMGSPAGSSYHSARDLLRFILALNAGRLIDDEGRRMLWEPRVKEHDDFQYGFLWGTQLTRGQRSVGHNGGGPGVSADFRHFPELGYTLIVLSNYGRAAGPVADWIAATLTGLPAPSTSASK